MGRYKPVYVKDDVYLVANTTDVSGGANSRVNDAQVPENMAVSLINVDISEPGKRKKFKGSELIANDVGNDACWGLHNFTIQGASDQLLLYEGTNLRNWTGAGNWSAALKDDFTAAQDDIGFVNIKMSGISPDDACIIQNGTDNAQLLESDGSVTDLGNTSGTGTDSPPISTVMGWYGNRLWIMLNDLAYFSEAYSSDYSSAFDTVSDAFRIPVGEERCIIATRDSGIIFGGQNAIWTLAPSVVPDPSTDKPYPLVPDHGIVGKRAWVQYGDNIYFFSQDGVRDLKRTVQDKLQLGISYPLSYPMKSEFESLSWAYITKTCATAFDNKILFCVPVDGSAYPNQIWIFNPTTNGWSVRNGLKIGAICTYKVSGEERCYYADATDGKVYRLFYGTDDNGSDIVYQEETRAYDLGYPLQDKNGGEYILRCEDGGGTITVYYQIDDNGWVQLGTLDTSGSAVTFPTSFPVIFYETGVVKGVFHLDVIGDNWRKIQFKHYNNSDDDITILSNSIVTFIDEYQSEG